MSTRARVVAQDCSFSLAYLPPNVKQRNPHPSDALKDRGSVPCYGTSARVATCAAVKAMGQNREGKGLCATAGQKLDRLGTPGW